MELEKAPRAALRVFAEMIEFKNNFALAATKRP
jgi:hypothetical protein